MKLKTLFLMLAAACSLTLTSCLDNGDEGGAKPKGGCSGKNAPTTTTTTETTVSAT